MLKQKKGSKMKLIYSKLSLYGVIFVSTLLITWQPAFAARAINKPIEAKTPTEHSIKVKALGSSTQEHYVNFSGVTGSKCNVRSGPTLTSRQTDSIPGNTRVNFNGWVEGDSVRDYWSGIPDTKWFFYTDRNNQKAYVTSAIVYGNPPEDTNTNPPEDPNTNTSATVPNIKQRMDQWCWATTTSAILQHYGYNVTQEQVVTSVKGSLVNESGYPNEMLNGLRNFGLNANYSQSIPSYTRIQSEINAGNPMETMISWTSGGGHAQVLDGCYSNNGTNYVKIMDPWYGEHSDYEVNSYKNSSKQTWVGYINNFSKR
ncbi:C39 family peptidase [Clostridium estertheticum]|uniref:papain-like cysteine protease family protein n=1 Tax=Clostridium estertheticum TaxID=238834 RepID=UPI001CCA5125|nr:papain-like cysteine protease family protein [Clostridium estertheticum]MBZ9607506.1 C39 family peptidase [Clostridium estertheticum]